MSVYPVSDAAKVNALWYTRCPVPTASSIALHQRWLHAEFERDGITLASVRASEDQATRDSHYDNSLERMFREGGNVPAIWARASSRNTVVVGITWVDEFQAIVTRPNSGITGPADLFGRLLGLPRHPGHLVDHGRASALHGFVSALSLAGLGLGDAEFVDISAPRLDIRENSATGVMAQADGKKHYGTTLEALNAGVVDAIYVKGPNGIDSVREHGLRIVADLGWHPDLSARINNAVPRPVTADRDLVRDRPDLVARYLAVLLRTGRWAEANPAEVLRLVALETGSSEASASLAYGTGLHRSFLPSLSHRYVTGLETQKNFLRSHGFLPNDFDFADWIDPRPLAEAERIVAGELDFALAQVA
jgi:ABC-type nitrate/sulfonate/bicarbonate transport system substrate-binding protein